MPSSGSAVFLSYASEDAAAARELCEALRAAGVEVWFDQSELRGGDAWDQKIRRQIKDCALFVPVISAHTQSRLEGYFRLEWRLAEQRTHLMARGKAFLLPVVVDSTRDDEAHVPEAFLEVQWTRLSDLTARTAFATRVRNLLAPPAAPALPTSNDAASSSPPGAAPPVGGSRSVVRRGPLLGAAAAAAVVAGIVWWRFAAPPPPAAGPQEALAEPAIDPRSLAVLPFANLSPDPDNAFFAQGMHEDVITNLAKIRALRVISRTSVMRYQDRDRSLREIAAELGVARVLEGSVRRAGDRVRITAQLINADTDEHVWAETYDRHVSDLFALQSEIAETIAATLQAVVLPEEKARIERPPTTSPDAYDRFLRARVLFSNTGNSPELVRQVEALLQEAVTLDPAFVEAWADLARYNAVFYSDRRADPTPERLAAAEHALARAGELAPEAPATRKARGALALFARGDPRAAAAEFAAVVAEVPGDADAWTWLGMAQTDTGDPAAAVPSLERALRLDPNSLEASASLLQALQLLRRHDECWRLYQRLQQTAPLISRFIPEVFIRLGADGDTEAFLAGLRNSPFGAQPRVAPEWALGVAYYHHDFAALLAPAERAADGVSMMTNQPMPNRLIAALGHFLQGETGAARREAELALPHLDAAFAEQFGSTAIETDLALAHALAGHTTETLHHLGLLAAAPPPPLSRIDTPRSLTLRVVAYGIIGHRDEALALLHDTLQGPFLFPPTSLRIDPLLRKVLGDDPRFEEVLTSAPRL